MVEDRTVMTHIFSAARAAALAGAALALTACVASEQGAPSAIVVPQGPLLQQEARTIGNGAITVAMLLPLSAGGSASGLAEAFQNAAELALADSAAENIRIVVRDTGGDGETARLAAEASVADGAQLILGPVFAPAVAGASAPARAANVPVIAFSTDATTASRGVYLLSFLPRQDATRVVQYAGEQGARSFGALVPDNGYGLVMEAAFREAVAASGGRMVGVERYPEGGVSTAADALAARGAMDAVFIPNGGNDPSVAAAALANAGVSARLLGSGQWANSAVLSAPGLAGALYPGPQKGGYEAFVGRYRAQYGAEPPRTASLVYDAVLLANGLAGARGGAAFRSNSLEGGDGFIGVDGIFRLTGAGLSERGLAVFEVEPGGGSKVVSPAPAKFARAF